MKYLVVLCALVAASQCKVLPERVTNILCSRNDPDYNACTRKAFEKSIPILVKGIPEINMPPIDPLELPFMSVDRTINELVSIKAVMKNIKVLGASNIIIEDTKANPHNYTAEMRITLPWTHLDMDYDAVGQLLIIPLRSKGFFSGNFTNTQIYAKGNLKLVDKNGVKYFQVDKYNMKIRVGDGEIKLIADNPDLQFGADLIANFYNENPRRVMDAVNPIFVETATDLYRVILNQVLATIPAKELLPE
ncbi:uncharacterized protein LOC123013922 [Tribolium madens]|uniref:uncharacterized protein LOC123013922 n=1 Tax=Tribolium madens TaxID=41895 RepID=UPI001CF72C5C|nr:uncharacterized protein LOC123013922 [Tribolium madens]